MSRSACCFLYGRGFVAAMGREFYGAVAGDPEMDVSYAECEEMCYFFAHLSRGRFGKFPDTGSGISRESGSNLTGAGRKDRHCQLPAVASPHARLPLLRIGRYVAVLRPAPRLRACAGNRLTRSRRQARR